MAVTQEESDKLLKEASKCLEELRAGNIPLKKKQLLAVRISQLVKWATNIELKVDPETGALSGKMVPNSESKVVLR